MRWRKRNPWPERFQRAFGEIGMAVQVQDWAEQKRDSLPRVRMRPVGRALKDALQLHPDDDLTDLYDPDKIGRSFYKPTELVAPFAFLPVANGDEKYPDPASPHRIQTIRGWKGGKPVMQEHIVRTGSQLRDLVESDEYRRSRFYETTGRWEVPDSRQYANTVGAFTPADPEIRRKLRESSIDPFAYGDLGDNPTNSTDVMGNVNTEFVPIAGGPYFRQLYLYAHWEQTAKAFEAKNHSELARCAITTTSDFALGRGIAFKVKNEKVKRIWQEFWDRNKMEQRLRVLSDDLVWQGELLLHKFETLKGFVSVRSFDPSAIYEIVTDPFDCETVFFYHYQAPCLVGDTRIELLDGTAPTVAELATRTEPYWVYSYDHETKRVVPGLATKTWHAGTKRCVRVTLDSGEAVKCSYDHPFLMRDGRYVLAEELQSGDSLMPLYIREQYRDVWQPEAGWQRVHHMVAGTPVAGEHIHHKNHRKVDNRPENLERMSRYAHMQYHKKQPLRTGTLPTRPKMTDVQRAELAARKKAWWDAHPEQRERCGAEASARWSDPKKRKTMGAAISRARKNPTPALKRLWADPEWRARTRATIAQIKKGWWDAHPEERQRVSELAKARWRDPVIRQRMSTGMRAAKNRDWMEDEARKAVPVRNHKVLSVESIGDREVYDVQVEKYHNFGLSVGVFTHNTAYTLPYTQFKGVNLNVPLSRYVIQQYAPNEIYHLKNNVSSTEKWGRSDFYASLSTLKRHRDWTNATVIKGMLQANLVWKIKITGDDADVQAFLSDPNNATLPAFGGTWVENTAVTLEGMHEDVEQSSRMSEGSIGNFLTSMFAAAQQMPVSYFNVQGRGMARATAMVQGEPFAKKIATRQQMLRGLLDHLYQEVMERAVRAGRLDARDLRGDDADPEWVFPTIYEEDRASVLTSLVTGKGMGWVSHRSSAIRAAQEMGFEEYDYEDEMLRIQQERKDPFLSLWPPAAGGTQSVTPPISATNPVPALPPPAPGAPPPGAPPTQPGPAQHAWVPPDLAQGHTDAVKGADARHDFRRQQQEKPLEAVREVSSLTESERAVLTQYVREGKRGRVELPTGRVAVIREKAA